MQDKKIIQLVVGPIATNCWIYPIDDASVAIVDPGDEADAIISALKKSNLAPKYILLTHGHFDHIMAVPKLKAEYPQAQIAIHSADAGFLGEGSFKIHDHNVRAALGSTDFPGFINSDLPPADIILEDGSTIGPFSVLNLPGHTPGSSAFYDKETGVLFTGDTLFKMGYGRTDLPGGSQRQIMNSLKRLFEMDDDIGVFPGHGETTTIGQEKR